MDRHTAKWLAAALTVCTVLVCVTVLWIHGPEDAQAWIAMAVSGAAGTVGPIVVALLGRDRDGDGIPDVLERDDGGAS